jgi:hypothetical protein
MGARGKPDPKVSVQRSSWAFYLAPSWYGLGLLSDVLVHGGCEPMKDGVEYRRRWEYHPAT